MMLELPITEIRKNKKVIDKGIVLSEYNFRSDLKNNKSWSYSMFYRDFVTKLSHKKNGKQYIPIKNIKIDTVYFFFKDNDYFRVIPRQKEFNFVIVESYLSSKTEYAYHLKKYITVSTVKDINKLAEQYFTNKRDINFFIEDCEEFNNKIIYRSNYAPGYQFRKVLKRIGFIYNPAAKTWILN